MTFSSRPRRDSLSDSGKQTCGKWGGKPAEAGAVVEGDAGLPAQAGELVAMSQKGTAIRTGLDEIQSLSRATQGVRVMKLREGDRLASFVVFESADSPTG